MKGCYVEKYADDVRTPPYVCDRCGGSEYKIHAADYKSIESKLSIAVDGLTKIRDNDETHAHDLALRSLALTKDPQAYIEDVAVDLASDPTCTSCGAPYHAHLGLVGTCEQLRVALEALGDIYQRLSRNTDNHDCFLVASKAIRDIKNPQSLDSD